MAAAEEAKKLADSMNTTALSDPNYCGSCYGGDHPDGRLCCNTCEEVRKGYGTKGWGAPNYDDVEQVRGFHFQSRTTPMSLTNTPVYLGK